MDSDFTDRFNYLAAFLVAILGLAIFKDTATSHNMLIFGKRVDFLQISLPLVSSIITAVYFGALTLLVKRLNFSLFPLGKYLGNLSDTIAALGLFYPLFLAITCLVSFSLSHLNNFDHLKITFSVITTLQSLVAVYIATRYARTRERDATEAYALKIGELDNSLDKTRLTSTAPMEQIFELYEHVLYRAKTYLRLKGYGVSGGNLGRVAQVLANKDVLDANDVKDAKLATSLRNAYAHAVKKPSGQEYQALITNLKRLDNKLGEAYYELAEGDPRND